MYTICFLYMDELTVIFLFSDSGARHLCRHNRGRRYETRNFGWSKETANNRSYRAYRLNTHWSCLISRFSVLIWPCDLSFSSRGNDNWSNKSSLHGWDIQWFRHLNHISDCHLSSAIDSHNRLHCFGITSSASTRDIWPIWWHHLDGRGQSRVPWTSGQCSWVLWAMWLPLPNKKRRCWFPTRGVVLSPNHYFEIQFHTIWSVILVTLYRWFPRRIKKSIGTKKMIVMAMFLLTNLETCSRISMWERS